MKFSNEKYLYSQNRKTLETLKKNKYYKIMSGSGGGGYIPPQRTKFDCETSIIITNVSSINVKVLAKHTIGSILDVIIGDNGELLLEDGDGEILGAVLHSNTPDMIICINEGTDYEAKIQSINTPVCAVKITRK